MTPPEARAAGADETLALDDADDRTLVDAFLSGRREAFDEIVRRHRRHVYVLCFRFVSNHEDAADLAQDVFVRAFRGLGRFKHDASLGTWLYRITVNTCLNHKALRRLETEPVEAGEHVDVRVMSPVDAVVRQENAIAVRRAIRQLPPRQRATLILRIYQDLSHEEIARILGGTVGAAKTNFFHALGNLRRLLST
jgi:RNA polymerase sigma-70 factor (ECF subfamily)